MESPDTRVAMDVPTPKGQATLIFPTNPKQEEGQEERTEEKKRIHKEARRALIQQIQWEKVWITTQQTQLIDKIKERVKEDLRFLPDPSLSVNLNTRKVLSNTTQECYFDKVHSKLFHDLTMGKSMSPSSSQDTRAKFEIHPHP